MTTAIAAGRPVALGRRLRKHSSVRPEWSLYALALLAWSAVLGEGVLESASSSGLHHHDAPARLPELALGVGRSMLMVAAMMLPLVVPHARVVVRRGLWVERHRAIAAFSGGYLAAWLAFCVAWELTLVAAGPAVSGPGAAVLLLLVAAAWQCTPARRALWARCCRLRPMAAAGRRAMSDRFRAGRRIGWLCVGTCGPVMAVMTVAHGIGTAVALSAVLFTEHRRGPNPAQRIGASSQAAWLVIIAGAVGLAAAFPGVGRFV